MKKIKQMLQEKENCLKNLNDIQELRAFYEKMRELSLNELKELFPVPAETIAQTVFDCTNEMIAKPTLKTAVKDSLVLFSQENFEKSSQSPFQKDMALLQALFFFLIEEISKGTGKDFKALLEVALKEGTWRQPEKQAELLNKLSEGMKFNREGIFTKIDFMTLGYGQFPKNESVLRLFYNFMHPVLYAKEGIINELNFVREQQLRILPVGLNTKKTNYSPAEAKNEINRAQKNLELLRDLDFGFEDDSYTQSFFINNEKFKEVFTRPVFCKCFAETELEWDEGPVFSTKKPRKIVAVKSIRAANKACLKTKFLYSERNIITHEGENAAVYRLLVREYPNSEKLFLDQLILESLYDIKKHLAAFPQKAAGEKLLKILDHYFIKITKELYPSELPVNERWNKVFDKKGEVNLQNEDLKKTYVFDILTEEEMSHFKRFLGLIYCSENDDNDFFERNRMRIQLYLIYISLNLSLLDKSGKKK